MARETIVKGPNFVHPEKPSAVGSRNSMNRKDRDEYKEAQAVVDEEVDKILNHIHAKLPPEVLEKLDVMGSIKSKLHNYFNQDFQNMLNRYIVTMEDEMSKKFRNLVDKEESRTLNRYTPREITDLIDRIGGAESFNTGEVERSVVNMYGHMQSHVERGVSRIRNNTNALLREKSDVGAFIQGENSYTIVKCSFRDNPRRPKSVLDMKLSISINDAELISPIYHYDVPVSSIIKDLVSKNIHELIDRELENTTHRLESEGKEGLTGPARIIEKLNVMDNYVSDEDSEDSKRYRFVAKKFMEAVDNIQEDVSSENYDSLQIGFNIKKIIDRENIRDRGFNTAVNTLTAILDSSKMSYQFIENFKNARECVIREYEDEESLRLPDERYSIRLVYYDQEQLQSLRETYSSQMNELEREVKHLWAVVEGVYKNDREEKGYDDWETLAERMLNESDAPAKKGKKGRGEEEPTTTEDVVEKAWNEITFVQPKDTKVSQSNPTGEQKIEELSARFPLMQEKLNKVYADDMNETRKVIEARLKFIQEQFEEFTHQINPYHVQPGLLLDIDIVSIKKKKTTMLNMSNVINEFLFSVSKGFTEIPLQGAKRTGIADQGYVEEPFVSVL